MRHRLLLTGLALLSAGFFLWLARPELTGEFVEGDLAAYFLGAERLIASGSPYQESYRALAPLVPLWLDWQVYAYTPLMAQLFTPLVGFGFHTTWLAWFAVSVSALIGAGLLGWRAGGGRLSPAGAALSIPLLIGVTPVAAGLATGRPEPLIALAVGFALVSNRAAPALALVTLLRLTPAPLILPYAIATGRPLRTIGAFAASGALGLAIAALLAPLAWWEFLVGGIGAMIAAMPLSPEIFTSLSGAPGPAVYLALSGFMLDPWAAPDPRLVALVEPLRLVSTLGSLLLIVVSVHWSRDAGRRHAALAAALVATLLAPMILWDYHLIALLPIALASWASGGVGSRRALLLAVAIGATVPLELLRNGGIFPLWWQLISLPIALCVLEAARRSRLPARS